MVDTHSKLMGLLVRCPYVGCADTDRQYAVNWLMNNGVTIQNWISVTERLPDQYHRVFMAGRNGGVFIGERTSGTTAVSDGHSRGFTHWMELPKEPED